MGSLLRRLGSTRLALLLLFLLAFTAVFATAIPQGLEPAEYRTRYPAFGTVLLALGLDHFYTGPLYRGLLTVFTANLLACGVGRSADGFRAWRGRGRASLQLPGADPGGWSRRLAARGFRIASGRPFLALLRPWAFLGFPLVHLALPLILAGGLWGSLAGFVGTRTAHVGDVVDRFVDWSTKADRPLGFQVSVDDFQLLYYPIRLKLRVAVPGGAPVELDAREGGEVSVPDSPYRVAVGRFDPRTEDLVFWVSGPAGRLGPFSRDNRAGSPVDVRPAAFRDPEIRRAEVRVSVLDGAGAPVRRAVVAVNEPLVHGGVRVFLTAWGRDAYGFPWVGFQVVREPGQWLVWLGACALSAGLFVLLFGHGAWVREANGGLEARGSRGRRALRRLLGAAP